MRRLALPLVLVAWVLGDLGATDGGLRLVDAAAVLVVVLAVLVVRREGAVRVDLAAVGYLVLAVAAEIQLSTDRATFPQVLALLTPALLLVSLPNLLDADDRANVRAVAWSLAAIGVWTIADGARALIEHGRDPFAFYSVKVAVGTPLADHNVLASILLVGMVAAALRADDDPRWIGALVVTSAALAATLSRGAALVGLGLAALAGLLARGRRLPSLLGPAALASFLLILGAAAVLGADIPDPGGPTSVVSRTQLWRAGIDAVGQEPLVGVGLDGVRQVAEAAGAADPRDHTHSVLLQGPATLGLPLGVIHISLWGLLLLRGWRHPDRHVRLLLVLGGAGLAVHGLIDETALRGSIETLVAVLLAVGSSAGTGVRDIGPGDGHR